MNTLTRYSFVPIACSILLFIQRHFQFSPEMDRFPTLFHVKKSSRYDNSRQVKSMQN